MVAGTASCPGAPPKDTLVEPHFGLTSSAHAEVPFIALSPGHPGFASFLPETGNYYFVDSWAQYF